ncbi:probable G-protein coupled receptor 139 [Hypanus sabinus]|uniref:probable G-protein coupled receptor 139 n=1 Tax=Hypanus sabinus TaxID=79690 RepID=UPI0028C3B060|nr:probable G-protein coupled receptor 139 [Hypanus sabinus]
MDTARKICYPVIAAIGVPVNLVAIVVLSRGKCGLSKGITRYLVAMAVADLAVVIIEVGYFQIVEAYRAYWLLLPSPFCLVHFAFCYVSLDCSVWLTVAFTFDRFVAICWFKIQAKYCNPRIAGLVIGTTCVLLCLKNVPYYFLHREAGIRLFDGKWWTCPSKGLLHMEPGFELFYWMDRLLNPLLPFFLILLLNILTVRRILASSRVRRGLRGQRTGEKQQDPEMKSRRQSIVLLFTLSASFLLCWSTTTLVFILLRCLYTDLETSIRLFMAQRAGAVIQLFSCCTNTFIYGVTQSKFREQLTIAALYPSIPKIDVGGYWISFVYLSSDTDKLFDENSRTDISIVSNKKRTFRAEASLLAPLFQDPVNRGEG